MEAAKMDHLVGMPRVQPGNRSWGSALSKGAVGRMHGPGLLHRFEGLGSQL